MKLIDLYKIWMKDGLLPGSGLCNSIPFEYRDTLNLFSPTEKEELELQINGQAWAYWGYEGYSTDNRRIRCLGFTELRQTIVLFICAMNDEL